MRPFFNYYTGTLTEVERQLLEEAENDLRQRIVDISHDLGADEDWSGSAGHVEAVLDKLRGMDDPDDRAVAEAIMEVDGMRNAVPE